MQEQLFVATESGSNLKIRSSRRTRQWRNFVSRRVVSCRLAQCTSCRNKNVEVDPVVGERLFRVVDGARPLRTCQSDGHGKGEIGGGRRMLMSEKRFKVQIHPGMERGRLGSDEELQYDDTVIMRNTDMKSERGKANACVPKTHHKSPQITHHMRYLPGQPNA